MSLLAKKAADFARERHVGQFRKDGRTSYATHPLRVARRLEEAGITEPDVLTAAALHDTIEDTPTTRDEIAARFGASVADLVEEVTRRPGIQRREFTERLSHCTERAVLIRLADRLDNLRESEGLGEEFLPVYAQEALRMLQHALRNPNLHYLSSSDGVAFLRLCSELVDAAASHLPHHQDAREPEMEGAPRPRRRARR